MATYSTSKSNVKAQIAFHPGGGRATLTVGFPDHLPFMSSMIRRQPIGALEVFSGTDGLGCQAAAINNSRSNIKNNLAFQLNHVTVLRTRVLPDLQWEIEVTYDSVDCGAVNYAAANFGSVIHGLAAMLPPGVTNRAVTTKGISGI